MPPPKMTPPPPKSSMASPSPSGGGGGEGNEEVKMVGAKEMKGKSEGALSNSMVDDGDDGDFGPSSAPDDNQE